MPTHTGRAFRGYTLEPCHGCGKVEERKKATVCHECRDKLEAVSRIAAEQAAAGEKYLFRVPARARDLPHINEHDGVVAFENAYRLTRAIHAALMSVAELPPDQEQGTFARGATEARTLFEESRYDAARRSYELRLLTETQANAFRRIVDEARGLEKRAHEDGKGKGQSLLAQLARGDITSDEFNKNAARLDDD